jgi:hypothetical protein
MRLAVAGEAPLHPFVLYGLRRKDTRALIALIRRAIAGREPSLSAGGRP